MRPLSGAVIRVNPTLSSAERIAALADPPAVRRADPRRGFVRDATTQRRGRGPPGAEEPSPNLMSSETHLKASGRAKISLECTGAWIGVGRCGTPVRNSNAAGRHQAG